MGIGSDVNVNKRCFFLVNNLKEFNNYPWGKLSYRVTRRSLINASNKTDVSKVEKTLGALVYNLYGFPHVFQAWIFQTMPILTEKYAVKNKDRPQALHPRILQFKVTRARGPLHKQILKELSCVDGRNSLLPCYSNSSNLTPELFNLSFPFSCRLRFCHLYTLQKKN